MQTQTEAHLLGKRDPNMNYQTLFNGSEILRGRDFCCTFYQEGGQVSLSGVSLYPMIFVLQGSMDIHFTAHERCPLKAGEVIAAARRNITKCLATPNTVVLEYAPPKRLTEYFEKSKIAFGSAYTSPIVILEPLFEWINDLIDSRNDDIDNTESLCFTQRQRLARILLSYPPTQMGELYIPFRACARGDCAECLAATVTNK